MVLLRLQSTPSWTCSKLQCGDAVRCLGRESGSGNGCAAIDDMNVCSRASGAMLRYTLRVDRMPLCLAVPAV
jgi:hypothetical protein